MARKSHSIPFEMEIIMNMNKTILFLSTILGSSIAAQANDIYLGRPGYGGTGCPAGTVSVTLSPDAQSLSLLFDEYQVEVGGATGRSLHRKSCNVAIPVNVPQGYSVSVFNVDYRGYNYLPRSASSQFNVEYFFAGSQGPSFSKSFYGPIDSDYLIQNKLRVSALVWSPCGADVILCTNSSIRVRTSGNREAMATVDSEDVNAAIIYRLQWRRCSN